MAQLMYQHSLLQAEARISNAWEADTVAPRDKTMQEFSQWLSQLPAQWDRSLMNCTPADVVAFLESYWLGAHAGTMMPDGSCISSPSGLNQCLSSMSTGFTLLGRLASWTPEHPSGNPIQFSLISSYRKGYKRQAWHSGYLEGSAVPISKSKVDQLIDYLDSLLLQEPSTMTRLLLQRDALLALLMWERAMRGNNCGKLTLGDMSDAAGRPVTLPMSEVMPAGSMVIIKPNGTKTVKGRRSGPFQVVMDEDIQHCFLGRLPAYLNQRLSKSASIDSFLFKPLTSNKQSFKDCPMSASDIGKRTKHHLQQASLYAGESCHGFRRGQM